MWRWCSTQRFAFNFLCHFLVKTCFFPLLFSQRTGQKTHIPWIKVQFLSQTSLNLEYFAISLGWVFFERFKQDCSPWLELKLYESSKKWFHVLCILVMFSLSLSCVASHVPYILEDLLLEVSWDSMKKSLQLCRLIEVKITMQIEFQLIFRNLFFDLQWFSKPVFFLVSEWVSDIFIIEFSSLYTFIGSHTPKCWLDWKLDVAI